MPRPRATTLLDVILSELYRVHGYKSEASDWMREVNFEDRIGEYHYERGKDSAKLRVEYLPEGTYGAALTTSDGVSYHGAL